MFCKCTRIAIEKYAVLFSNKHYFSSGLFTIIKFLVENAEPSESNTMHSVALRRNYIIFTTAKLTI